MILTEHETVGRRFSGWDGGIYFCYRWERRQGYWMRLVAIPPGEKFISRKIGDEANVSERAIGGTYHEIHPWGPLKAYFAEPIHTHEQPCNCYVCEKRDVS